VTASPAHRDARSDHRGNNLSVRTASSLVLVALALVTAWVGGVIFTLFWAAAAIVILWEWVRLVAGARQRGWWLAAGILYAGITFVAPVGLRADPRYGLGALLFLFAIVWVTDVMAYLVGRLAGGPKLWPSVSPNKTWSGALGATAGALAVGCGTAAFGGLALIPIAILAVILSMVAQAGDLLESAVKRRFGAKDTGHLIPGHGGLMDRLDGFIAAALIAVVVGVLRGGLQGAGQGLLVW
jgi:phosphatidate cytidylyltransferase